MKHFRIISAVLFFLLCCAGIAGSAFSSVSGRGAAPVSAPASEPSAAPAAEKPLRSEEKAPAVSEKGAAVSAESAGTSAATPSAPAAPADTARKARYSVRHTVPLILEDWRSYPLDLRDPQNLVTQVEYVAEGNYYLVRTMAGDEEVGVPLLLTPQEYAKWSLEQSNAKYYREKNRALMTNDSEDFSFTNLHFDLGPAEKIFGPGGVQIKTRGSAELQFGISTQKLDNPSLSERQRKTTAFDFDEKINLNVTGSVGDKMSLDFSYNTEASFDFDAQKLKLQYEGKEDEIIQLLEAGNVSMPSNSSLIKGASSLFGVRADMQFGKLKVQTVISQQESETKTVNSKGGVQTTPFEIKVSDYDDNRHFFLAQYFYNTFDRSMEQLPNIMSGITINRIEVWVTNKSGSYDNPRNVVAFTQLGETTGTTPPQNSAGGLYAQLTTTYAGARTISQASTVLSDMDAGYDYEKIESARLLSSNEYTLNSSLGFIHLRSALKADEVLGVAFEYTYMGQTYQVGEFSSDITDNSQALFVKLLKSTVNSPSFAGWNLMMKNVYSLRAYQVQKDDFTLDISYQNDSAGAALKYISEGAIAKELLIRVMNLDRLDKNNKRNPDGVFDFVSGYTVNTNYGLIIFPVTEPFGSFLRSKIGNDAIADKYCFEELYDSTQTYAKQLAEKDKFILSGEYKASSGSQINLGATNIPRGSVVVTAGGVTLVENTDYSVDYNLGIVTILNQSIIDAGTAISVSLESNSNFSLQRKTMLGVNLQYEFSKNLTLGATVMHLSEKPLRTKVSIGDEPINNTIWGAQISWKKESQWLTNMLDKLPFLTATAPSTINLTAEVAQLIPGHSKDLQDEASYIDDFESAELDIDLRSPSSWMLSSTPSRFPESSLNDSVDYGFNRALLAWYYIDPLFTNRSSSLTPGHIKGDLNQLSNHYVREVYQSEVFPNRETAYNESSTLNILNLAYYPEERGPYNLDPHLNPDGTLPNPRQRWGGIMRKMDNPDFETANVGYIEFWLLDPFIYNPTAEGGELYLNLGEISEDVLKDGRKFFENGLPTSNDGTTVDYTSWGKVPNSRSLVYAFDTNSGSRTLQDVGLNGLSSEEERNFPTYSYYLEQLRANGVQNMAPFENDPAGDTYHYFRGSDYDQQQLSILARYKKYNNTEGNSVASDDSPESYDVSAKSTPDVEDINQDFTLNESEKYFEYRIPIRPDMQVGDGFITSIRTTSVTLRNGQTANNVKWYQFKVPIHDYTEKVGSIDDFSSIRFMRMYMTNFPDSVVLRFAKLALVRADWRTYDKTLRRRDGGYTSLDGNFELYAVNIEENSDKEPVNYVMPPGISRVIDPGQPQLRQENEQALSMRVSNLKSGDAKAAYKSTSLDLRRYNRLQFFAHCEALSDSSLNYTPLDDKEVAVFIRLGSDYNNNYYEYEIPLDLTPPGTYNGSTLSGCQAVWPEANMLDINPSVFTDIKKERNSVGASYTTPFSRSDSDKPNNTITIVGNPSLANIKTMMIGVRNLSASTKSAEVWVNELRVKDFDESGGWAAQGNLSVQLSDVGSLVLTGHVETAGFGGLEESVSQRRTDNYYQYAVTTNIDAGRFLPHWLKLNAPLYFSYSKEILSPEYDPVNEDLRLEDVLDTYSDQAQKDSVLDVARTISTYKNFSLSNLKFDIKSKKPMPYDPANFAFTYSFSKAHNSSTTTRYDNELNWKLGLTYNYSPVYKAWTPFAGLKSKSSALKFVKALNFNYLPQNVGFSSDISRYYQETQLRDIEDASYEIPVSVSKSYLWNRKFVLRWDFTKNLQMNFNSGTQAEIEEPAGAVNKSLYPDEYSVWKDSVRRSLLSFGRPLDYQQNFSASYKVPFDLIPILDWVSSNATYTSSYTWERGTEMSDGTSLGNTIANQATFNLTGKMELEKFYNKVPFLRETNKKFSSSSSRRVTDTSASKKKKGDEEKKEEKKFEKEIKLLPDSNVVVSHGQNSKNPRVTALLPSGKRFPIKYKVKDKNKIEILTHDTVSVKLTVRPGKKPEERSWYKPAQYAARFAMLVRSLSFTYRNTRSMTIPGFMPEVGDFFGQRGGSPMAPGLDFAFGFAGESYLQKAAENDWLLRNDSISSYASTSNVEEVQLKMTLEPVTALKIDLNASWQKTSSKSIQYMYAGMPTTQSGNFNMTIISIGTSFETSSQGNGYRSKTFDKFLKQLDIIQSRVQAQYEGAVYPVGTGNGLDGQPYDPANGTVNKYSADVLLPAFLSAYTGKDPSSISLGLIPALTAMMPNWNVTYSGLVKLPFIRDHFKSFELTHGYKSVYTIGSYNSYSSYLAYMGDIGFVPDVTTGLPIPSSPLDIGTVSINEAFSPLAGLNTTLLNGITTKLEYRRTRVVTLSVSALQIVESLSNDFVIGAGYKITDFQPWNRKLKGKNARGTKSPSGRSNQTSSVSHDLNLRADFSLRNQSALSRNIMDGTTQPTSGNKALKISLSADYQLSRQLTLQVYYDFQKNTPLISSSSYPVTNNDFGATLKFNLTR
ncbi:MAG: cell surface protein SprA [Bacteroidaceae bacterium]